MPIAIPLDRTLAYDVRNECFVCGHRIGSHPHALYYGPAEDSNGAIAGPQLPAHPECLNGRSPRTLTLRYHERIKDLVDLPR